MAESLTGVGRSLELTVGPVAHGGHCVARVDDEPGGRIVFVRHALPGERIRAVVTEDAGGSFVRADAVDIRSASADRVSPPCPHAGPGRCGGCDWQHASGTAQRELKAAVVREQFARLAAVDLTIVVEPLPGGLLGWRTRTLYARAPSGRLGLRRHRSHAVEILDACPLGVPGVGDHPVLDDAWQGCTGIEVARGDGGTPAVLGHRPGDARRVRGRRPPDRVELLEGPRRLRHRMGGRDFQVDSTGFWQVHPAGAAAFSSAMLDAVRARPGERVLDLYAGAGLFTAGLAAAVGVTGRVDAVEASSRAVADARANLADLPWAFVHRGRVERALLERVGVDPQVIVLDPPRSGAGHAVMTALLGYPARVIGYLSCDPSTLARDVRVALDAGWQLTSLRAFDAFPMTQHVECLAVLQPGPAAGQAVQAERTT